MRQAPALAAAHQSLTRLAAVGAAGVLAFASVWMLAYPPERADGPWARSAALATGLALAAGLAGAYPAWRWSMWIPVTSTSAALLTLMAVKAQLGFDGAWPVLEWLALGVVLASVAVPDVSAIAFAAGSVVVAGWSAGSGAGALNLFATPLAAISVSVRVAAVAFVLLAGTALLRRYARAADVMLVESRRALAAVEAEQRAQASRNRLRRELHDTWLNTLEAVARCRDDQTAALLRAQCAAESSTWLSGWITAVDGESDESGSEAVSDERRVETDPLAGVRDAFMPAIQVGRVGGVAVIPDVFVRGRPPDGILSATAAAAAEAVRNVVKHAGTKSAELAGSITESEVEVVVRDTGAGFPASIRGAGIGLRTSIEERMLAVGGTAEVVSEVGVGTAIHLRWTEPPAEPAPSTGGPDADPFEAVAGVDLVETLARVSRWAIVIVAAFGCVAAFVAIDSMRAPGCIAVSAVAVAGVSWWFVRQFRASAVTWVDIALMYVVLCAVTVTQPFADPYCTTVAGSALVPDGRLMVLALPVVLLASGRVLWIGLLSAIASLAVAAALWQLSWPSCVPQAALAGASLTILGTVALLFGRAIRSQQAQATRVVDEAWALDRDRARSEADEAVRAQWRVPIVGDVLDLLADIGTGVGSPLDSGLRREAALRSARLRAAIQLSALPPALAHAGAKLVAFTRERDVGIEVYGDPSEWTLADDRTMTAAQDLLAWLDNASVACDSVMLSFSNVSRVYSMVVQLIHQGHFAGEQVRVTAEVSLRAWTDEAGSWWQAEWISADS